MRTFRLEIDQTNAGHTIKDIFRHQFSFSTHMISRLKVSGGVQLNGKQVRVTHMVQEGDILCAIMPEEHTWIAPSDVVVPILYEDEDILIADKPPNMAVHPSAGNRENTLANALMGHWQRRGEQYIFRAVNRLDKGTSGLMAVAKNPHSHHILSRQLQEGRLNRTYLAICCGNTNENGKIDLPISRIPGSTMKRQISSNGKNAITHYQTIQRLDGYSLIELRLETGRTHQIRVHMSAIGHPLAGDWLYGERIDELDRPALHSSSISFPHPINHKMIMLTSKLPTDLKSFLDGREYL